MASVSQEQLNEYRDCFTLYDKDNRGQIDSKMLGTVVRSLGQRPTDGQVDDIIRNVLRKNAFSLDDLVNVMQRFRTSHPSAGEEEVRDAFRVFDRDGNGFVNAAEIRHVMTNLGEKLTDEEVDEMLRTIDVDSGGQIGYDDVVRLMCA